MGGSVVALVDQQGQLFTSHELGGRAALISFVYTNCDDVCPLLSAKMALVHEAYRYALANPDVLQYFPCYCGCVRGGHTSNKDCYIDELRPDGSVVLDPMSFG